MKLKLQLMITFQGRIIASIAVGLLFIFGIYMSVEGTGNFLTAFFIFSSVAWTKNPKMTSLLRILPIDKKSRFAYIILTSFAFQLFVVGVFFGWFKYHNALQQDYISILFLCAIWAIIVIMLETQPNINKITSVINTIVQVLSFFLYIFIFTRNLWPMEKYVYSLGYTVILSMIVLPINYRLYNVKSKDLSLK